MNETKYQKRIILAGIVALICASLYALGGISDKWLRRYLASAVFFIALALFKRDFKLLMFYPVLVLGLSMGYGADETWIKILQRLKVGIVVGLGVGLPFIYDNKIALYIFTGICCLAYVLLGVFNPFNSFGGGARLEEFVIGMFVFIPALLFSSIGGKNE